MNSCILMAQIWEAPKLRKTQDNQSLADIVVQFDGLRDGDAPSTLRVVVWGNLAEEVHQTYFAGDRAIFEGRLKMTTVEREESPGQRFKEKRAELIAARIHKVSSDPSFVAPSPSGSADRPSNVISMEHYSKPPGSESPSSAPEPATVSSPSVPPADDKDLDDIPF